MTLVDVDRNKVRIGFDADRSVAIFRQELLDVEPPAAPQEGVPTS